MLAHCFKLLKTLERDGRRRWRCEMKCWRLAVCLARSREHRATKSFPSQVRPRATISAIFPWTPIHGSALWCAGQATVAGQWLVALVERLVWIPEGVEVHLKWLYTFSPPSCVFEGMCVTALVKSDIVPGLNVTHVRIQFSSFPLLSMQCVWKWEINMVRLWIPLCTDTFWHVW